MTLLHSSNEHSDGDTIHGVLTEMSNIVLDFLDGEGFAIRDDSFFAQELQEIHSIERCEWLRVHLTESAYFLLQGIIDQACSIDSVLDVMNRADVSLTGRILLRTMLEYSYKLVYLTDKNIGRKERSERAIRTYSADLHEYKRLPPQFQGDTGQDQQALIALWYKELTGKDKVPQSLSARDIFNAVGDPEDDWPRDGRGKPINPVYKIGYQVNSVITHGNLWAIKQYGLVHFQRPDGTVVDLAGYDKNALRILKKSAVSILQLSLGFAVQFVHGHPPAHIMNRLNAPMSRLY